MGSLELPHPTSNTITMKFLVVLSALAVALAAPANVYSPYLLQDLAYNSVDANEDGQPDQAIAITHPVAAPVVVSPFGYHAVTYHAAKAPLAPVAPLGYPWPVVAPFALHHAPAVTRVHYASTPVVIGHS